MVRYDRWMLFLKYHVLHMVIDEYVAHVGSLVPLGLAWHVIVDGLAVDLESLEGDVAHCADGVVAEDEGHAWLVMVDAFLSTMAVVAYVAEVYVLHSSSWGRAIFGVVADFYLKYGALMDVFDAYVVEGDIFHEVVVTTVDGEASLVVYLRLALAEDVDIVISEANDAVHALGVAVDADEDGVCHVGPEGGVGHAHIAHAAAESLACSIGCGAVVAVAAEDTVVEHIAGGEDIEAVAPSWMGDAVDIVECHTVAAANGAGAEGDTVDENVGAAMDMNAFVAVGRAAYASPEDADLGLVFDGERAVDI